MSPRRVAFLAGLLVAVALGRLLGGPGAMGLIGGAALVASVAWLPAPAVRVLAALTLSGAAFGALRPLSGAAAAGVAALGVAAAARRLPASIARRVAYVPPSLVLLIYVTTLLMYLAPGSPFAGERVVEPEIEQALRRHYGIPEDPLSFFAIYLTRLVSRGSLGPSLVVQGRTVEDLLAPALPVSLALGLLALALAVTLGLTLGVRAGLRPGSLEDAATTGLALLGVSLPNFVIGAGLVLLFAMHLEWLPVAGFGEPRHLVLPVLTLALPHTAYIARLARAGTAEVAREDFVRTARAKGLPERLVVGRHILRAAVLPVVSFLGPAAAGILTGSFVVETLFHLPGMGAWFVKGAINRDYPLVLGTSLLYFGLVVLLNLLADLALAWLDPRTAEPSP